MGLQGKGFFIWKVLDCENGNPEAIATLAQSAGLSHVLVKIADTIYSYNVIDGSDKAAPLANALRGRGIQVWGWHYCKGNDPIGEADKAIERVKGLNLDGYVVDAEGEYKQPGKRSAATKFMNRLRSGLPDTPIALSSYRYPSYHPQLPFSEFLEKCDYNMPQVYWLQADNPGDQLERCIREFQGLTPFRPIVPTGAAFKEHGWQPTADQATEFLQAAQSNNLTAANFYSWDSCRKYLPEIWSAIFNYDWPAGGAPPDITAQYIGALNRHSASEVTNLYAENAVHVTAARTVKGATAIRAWYQTLFDTLLPAGSFTLTGFSGSGPTRHFTWTATSSKGRVLNGNDTFGLIEGKITYHYTFFTVT
jgi:hypothetical protein